MNCRLTFSKTGRLRFVGHLDTTEALRRAVRRAGLPVKYSGGFNPHMEVKLAAPLPLGMEGLGEYADIALTWDLDESEICERLNSNLPGGLVIRQVSARPDGEKSTAALLRRAEYKVQIKLNDLNEIQKNFVRFIAMNELYIEKKTKAGVKNVNIRKDIFELALAENSVEMTLALGGEGSLSSETVTRLLLGGDYDMAEPRYTRTRLILTTDLNGQDEWKP